MKIPYSFKNLVNRLLNVQIDFCRYLNRWTGLHMNYVVYTFVGILCVVDCLSSDNACCLQLQCKQSIVIASCHGQGFTVYVIKQVDA